MKRYIPDRPLEDATFHKNESYKGDILLTFFKILSNSFYYFSSLDWDMGFRYNNCNRWTIFWMESRTSGWFWKLFNCYFFNGISLYMFNLLSIRNYFCPSFCGGFRTYTLCTWFSTRVSRGLCRVARIYHICCNIVFVIVFYDMQFFRTWC